MDRNLQALADQTFDLLVIGGGIQGACVAWEASLRGLSVALVEKSDFVGSTSANSLKVIHGGLRYLQTADFKRMRQSIQARRALLRIAPHLIHPLPVLVPTYGHGLKGREAMGVALKINDWVSCDRNFSLADPQKHIPSGRLLSREACLERLPDLPTRNLTGAALFYDAQVFNSERLVLAFLQSAVQQGAQVANYVKVTAFLKQGDRVIGATVKDQQTGDTFEIRAKSTINTSGPWIQSLVKGALDSSKNGAVKPVSLAKAMNLVVRPVFSEKMTCAVGLSSHRELGTVSGENARSNQSSRLFFIAPWRHTSLVGTWYAPYSGHPDDFQITDAEIHQFLDEINTTYSTLKITTADILKVHAGLLPCTGNTKGEVKLRKHFLLTDHRTDELDGLLSVTAVKYTTALDVARRAVDWVFRSQGQRPPASVSDRTPLVGGDIDSWDGLFDNVSTAYRGRLNKSHLKHLIDNYGSAYADVLAYLPAAASSTAEIDAHLLTAEIHYHLQNTMPYTLGDLVFRRTDLGSAGYPGQDRLKFCAEVMGQAVGWSPAEQQQQINAIDQTFYRDLKTRNSSISKPLAVS